MSLFFELRRRNVFKVAAAYAIVAWLLIEVASTVFPIVQLPEWTVTLVTMLLLLGFPVAIVLAWAYELTSQGIERTVSVSSPETTTKVTGRNLDFAIIALMAVAILFLVVDNYILNHSMTARESADARPSIAVLPFVNQSAAEENAEFFATGMQDELLTRLTQISSLKVVSRTSVMQYANTDKGMRQIGRELGVATILEGGVQRAGDMLRINVQLIDAETDAHIWADAYNRELTAENIFAIQSEMATAIAESLQATILPRELARVTQVPTGSTRAWEFYLRGKDLSNQPDEVTFMPRAIEEYERALAEDPTFALAWVRLSAAHGEIYWTGIDPSESRLEMAKEAVEMALQLEPDLPEAHWALATYYSFGLNDYEGARRELAIAEQGMSGSSELYFTYHSVYRRSGRWQESIAPGNRAIELDPRNVDMLWNLASAHIFLHEYEQAESLFDRALEVQPDNSLVLRDRALLPLIRNGDASALRAAVEDPSIALGRFRADSGWLAAIYDRDHETALAYLGDWTGATFPGEPANAPKALYYGVTYQLGARADLAQPHFRTAVQEIESALGTRPENPFLLTALGIALAGLGENDEAISIAHRAMELMPTSKDALIGSVVHLEAIRVFVAALDYATAVDELDSYFDRPGEWSIEGLLPDPRFDLILNDPRFQALVEKYRRP